MFFFFIRFRRKVNPPQASKVKKKRIWKAFSRSQLQRKKESCIGHWLSNLMRMLLIKLLENTGFMFIIILVILKIVLFFETFFCCFIHLLQLKIEPRLKLASDFVASTLTVMGERVKFISQFNDSYTKSNVQIKFKPADDILQ